jgi:hypothetical protein
MSGSFVDDAELSGLLLVRLGRPPGRLERSLTSWSMTRFWIG